MDHGGDNPSSIGEYAQGGGTEYHRDDSDIQKWNWNTVPPNNIGGADIGGTDLIEVVSQEYPGRGGVVHGHLSDTGDLPGVSLVRGSAI